MTEFLDYKCSNLHLEDQYYSTPQLQGNIRTCFRCVSHPFRVCPTCILDASAFGKKVHGTHVRLAAALLQGFVLARMRLVCVPDVSCTHFRCVSHTFQMHLNITMELSSTVNGSLNDGKSMACTAYQDQK